MDGGIAPARQESPASFCSTSQVRTPLLPPHCHRGWKVGGNESWDTEAPLPSLRADAHLAEPSPGEVWTLHLHED